MIIKILTVAALATFEIYVAIPTGFAMGLNAWTIFFTTLIGGLVGVFVAAFLGDKIRAFINTYRKPKEEKPKISLIYKIWEKYGVIGLGLFGTFAVGAPVSLSVGVGFNVPLKKLVPWCCLAVLARCVIYTSVGHFGMKMFD